MMSEPLLRLPDYWLPQPPLSLDENARRACDALLAAAVAQGPEQPFEYTLEDTLAIPKWRFLCYVAEAHNLAIHGSHDSEIARFEPRQPSDLSEFGAQRAVYAAADGIWPMYFAIVDRAKSPSLVNACVRVEEADGTLDGPYYVFSLSKQAMAQWPYRAGIVYLLPKDTFIQQSPMRVGSSWVHIAQLASPTEVVPLAKLVIEPQDFPFLKQMRTHDDERLEVYAEAMMRGLPWPE